MDSKRSSNKITDIVRLQRLMKKWKNHAKANASEHNTANTITTTTTITTINSNGSAGKSFNKFLKRTLSFTDVSSSSSSSSPSQNDVVPKGFLAVDCVSGHQHKRYVIPTEYLAHRAFGVLLRDAEEEFGFQQAGVLKIPCQVAVFEKILEFVQGKKALDEDVGLLLGLGFDDVMTENGHEMMSCSSSTSPDCEPQLTRSHQAQMCR